jgi:acetyl-CoA carboxylase biotin carboxylase subunit
MVEEHGFTFVGPSPEHIRLMGDKIVAKATAAELGIPTVPGSDGPIGTEAEAVELAHGIGFPVLIKAVAGGGGRGMTVVREPEQLAEAVRMARNEARAAFGDDRVYVERLLDRPRHIEVQIVGDGKGRVVHLGERDCSLQRRHQKLVEEAPSPVLDAAARERLGTLVADAMRKLGYRSLGTVEFLYEGGEFYFIEMNTRLQVEHPVTELVTGIDLVREQLMIAAGHRLSFGQEDVRLRGHAIEVRINAEDPRTLLPSPGRVAAFHAPGGPGVRMDSALYAGYTVPPYYDSLIAKLIVHDVDRPICIRRLERCLEEVVIDGIPSSVPLLRAIFATDEVRAGAFDTGWLGRFLAGWTA